MKTVVPHTAHPEKTRPGRDMRQRGESSLKHDARPAVVALPAQAILQRSSACACGGGCPRCSAGRSSGSAMMVNRPGDAWEQEADRVASQVMRMADTADRSPLFISQSVGSLVQRACAACGGRDHGDDEEERGIVQAKEEPGAVPRVSPAVQRRIESLHGGGQPLSRREREFFEPRFGQDFSNVRLHTDAHAAESAREVRAHAYTLGSDIVFAEGRFAPGTADGMGLLAHELVHVVQQRGASATAMQPMLAVNSPGGADEVEADTVARQVMSGADRIMPVQSRPGAALQRAPNIGTDFQMTPGSARACLVHLHGDERTAFAAAQNIRSRYCTNFVFLENSSRCVDIAPNCKADPNRMFDPTAPQKAFTSTCPCPAANGRNASSADSAVRQRHTTAMAQLNAFSTRINAALATCNTGTTGALPMVAFHNNTPGAPLSIDSYSPGGNEAAATETDPVRLTPPGASAPVANPNIRIESTTDIRTDHDNFFLTTQPAQFFALRNANRNVVLQKANLSGRDDDGSLSVAMQNRPYINVEVENVATGDRGRQLLAADIGMGEAAMASLGIAAGPCPAPAAPSVPASGAPPVPASTAPVPSPATPAAPSGAGSAPAPMPRGGLAAGMVRERDFETATPRPTGCRGFIDQSDFDAGKQRWAGIIAGMPVPAVLGWITGQQTPPAAATAEASNQLQCMLDGLRGAASSSSGQITLPANLRIIRGYASDSSQAGIWNRKFNMTGANFDRITPSAVATCGPQIGTAGSQWEPGNECHRVCWGVLATPTSAACAIPPGHRALTTDERQREILEASSAPGISRHHYGTDFDLFSVDPRDWQRSGASGFADEYSWLARNASLYGFVQTFTPGSSGSMGYMPEDWHWSYLPIAAALLDFAQAHRDATSNGESLQDVLMRRWGPRPEFSYIRRNWRDFIFNVNQTPRF